MISFHCHNLQTANRISNSGTKNENACITQCLHCTTYIYSILANATFPFLGSILLVWIKITS